MTKYAMTLETLKKMDETQLLAMFEDIDDIETVELIAETAAHVVENYVSPEPENNEEDETVDWKRQDDTTRYWDWHSESGTE